MNNIDRAIWHKFRIRKGGACPYRIAYGVRDNLAELFGELKFNKGAEIGVQSGIYSEILLKNNPELKLLCVDPWSYYRGVSAEKSEAAYQLALKRLSPYEERIKIIRKPSVEAAAQIPDGSLDFVYIDGAHDFDNVMLDILHWAPKVRRYGIISGHDYYVFYRGGVIKAVDTYTSVHNINMWYVTQETLRSWFWVVDW